ncbi:MAG: S-layer homology domain-containing protein [Candidatus Gracilibacteria bacterium]|nr:S-layer homology domain-containing protein [Candidatus Gracilibacteria bacterium]
MYPLKIKEKYDQANLNNLGSRFTVVYLGTYKDGDYSEYVGSHPGVDIVPIVKNQDVLSVLDGKVFKSGEDGAYGKFVFIEHANVPDPDDFSKTTTLYSCYEHLSEIKVNIGDIIKEGDIIGKTGNTGNSFGEHLHFQIDRIQAPFHAYWPFTGVEAKSAGTSFTGGVNIGLGLDKAKMYTINPLVYLDKLIGINYKNNNSNNTNTTKLEEKVQPIISSNNNIVNNTIISTPNLIIPKAEEKLNIISSNDNNIVSDPTLKILSSLNEDLKKKGFSDINKSDKYYNYINDLLLKGIISGYSDGTFKPDNPISRVEFLKMLFLVKGISLSSDNSNYFSDVSDSSWQKKYVNTAVSLKLVSTSNKNFSPNSSISKVEALKMAIILFVGEINLVYSQELSDVGGGEWFSKYIEYAIKNNLLEVKNNNFYPNNNITRYEVIGMLYKLSEK